MTIKNNNGEFPVNAAQFNYLIHKFEFNMINWNTIRMFNYIKQILSIILGSMIRLMNILKKIGDSLEIN